MSDSAAMLSPSIFDGLNGYSTLSIVSLSTSIILGTVFFAVKLSAYSASGKFSAKAPKLVRQSYPILGALDFFNRRWDFFRHNRSEMDSGQFSYMVGKYPIVGLTGERARKLFFESKDLGFAEGYSVLFGQSPNSLDDTKISVQKEWGDSGGYFSRRITRMLKTENFGHNLPKLAADTKVRLEALSREPSGMTDPFESVYRIVYQLTMRIVGADDVAEDPELCERTLQLYETVEQSATPAAVLFPWFPSLGIIKRTYAGGRLYMIFDKIVKHRQTTGERRNDPLQYLMDQGDSTPQIIEFVIGALFAGLLNSGINVAWVLLYLSKNSEWKQKVQAEVRAAGAKYGDKDASLIDQLSAIPVAGWESEFPMLDLCLRDSIRLQLLGAAFRRNISGHDIPINDGEEVIPPGAYVTYHLGDVHLNPAIYRDPEVWDPSRYQADRAEDKKQSHAYVGWGTGRHPCLGMRFAKLEQNVITAFFLAMYDFELVDGSGKPKEELPKVEFNSQTAVKPKEKVFLKIRPVKA